MRDRTELKLVAFPLAGPFGVFLLFLFGYLYVIYVVCHIVIWAGIQEIRMYRRMWRKAEYARKNGML